MTSYRTDRAQLFQPCQLSICKMGQTIDMNGLTSGEYVLVIQNKVSYLRHSFWHRRSLPLPETARSFRKHRNKVLLRLREVQVRIHLTDFSNGEGGARPLCFPSRIALARL